jgi:hypothetical protein
MAQTRGLFPANVDNVDKVVFGVVGTTLNELKPIWKPMFRVESSDKKFERRVSKAMFTSVPLKSEGDDYTTQTIDQGYTKDFTHLEFGLAFEITETAEEDDQYQVYRDYAVGLARAARVAEETYGHLWINQGFSGGTETSPDGEPIFDAAHPLIKGGTASNLSTADLSYTELQNAIIALHTDQKSDEGHYMNVQDGWILFVPPALHFLADRLVNSTGMPGSADNDRNSVKSLYSIEVKASPYITDTDKWALVAKNKKHGLLSYTRVPIGMKPPVRLPKSDNRLYKLRFRRSWGVDRWQGLYASAGA